MNSRRLLIAAVALAAAGVGNRAQAQCGPYGFGGGFGAWDVGRLYGVLADNVPYYAAFPPVYYSQPVPRTYGYSPFAYPPGVMTPEVFETAEPQVIDNPYFNSPAPVQGTSAPVEPKVIDQTTSVAPVREPLVILNPYVSQAGRHNGMAAVSVGTSR